MYSTKKLYVRAQEIFSEWTLISGSNVCVL